MELKYTEGGNLFFLELCGHPSVQDIQYQADSGNSKGDSFRKKNGILSISGGQSQVALPAPDVHSWGPTDDLQSP